MTHEEMEEVKRHFGVVADGLRSDIRLVAEGHAALDLKFDTMRGGVSALDLKFDTMHQEVSATDLKFDTMRQGVSALDLKLDTVRQGVSVFREEFLEFRKDVQGEFRDLRALVRFSYAELDERVKFLERELASLRTRLDQIDGKQT